MRESQLALDGGERDAEHFRGFLELEAAEIPVLDDLRLTRIERFQPRERLVEIAQRVGLRVGRNQVVIPLHDFGPTAAPRGPLIQKITLETDVLFGFDKAELRPEGRQKLDEIADGLKDARVDEIVAIGHTDRIGPDSYNEKLSERRAQAVKEYLVQKGVSDQRITIEGKGEQSPVTGQDCSKLKGRKLIQCFEPDRRVEIEVFGEREVAATEGQQPGAGATSGSPGSSSGSGSGR